jgi:RNA polymerase sigma-70 factor (ECF subfamily)
MVQWFTVHARTAQGPEEEAPRGAAGSESPRWRALRDGDEDAFAELFRTHYAALCTVADRLLRVPAEAEEVVQDVFLRLWERRESLEAVADEGAYLRTAVRRRVIDRVRRSQTEATVIAHIAHEPVLSDIPDDDAARLLGAVRAAFVHLTPRCRAAMTLRWFERRSHAEIAALLEISPKGVERLITRGLATLRRVLPAEEDS